MEHAVPTATLPRRAPAPVANPLARHSGICHGTLGELVQGPYERDGELHIALVSLPLRRYSWMHFEPHAQGDADIDLAHRQKCRRAMALYLDATGLSLPPGRWSCESELLQGKGMASSTADMVATIRCLDSLFARRTAMHDIAAILRQVERSDSVFLDHYALYLSARQEVVSRLPASPAFHACYIDEGDSVDTEALGPRLLEHYHRQRDAYHRNMARALAAFRARDLAGIARSATTSACLAQAVVPKRSLDTMRIEQHRFGADGIVVAHTGSLIGYLYRRRPTPTLMGELSAFFRGLGHQCRFAQTGF